MLNGFWFHGSICFEYFSYFVLTISNLLCFLTTALWICMFLRIGKNIFHVVWASLLASIFAWIIERILAPNWYPETDPWGHHFRPKGNQNRWPRTPGNVPEPTWARLGAENAPRMHFHRSWCRFVWFGMVFSSSMDCWCYASFSHEVFIFPKTPRHTTCKPTRNMPTNHNSTILIPWPGGVRANIK